MNELKCALPADTGIASACANLGQHYQREAVLPKAAEGFQAKLQQVLMRLLEEDSLSERVTYCSQNDALLRFAQNGPSEVAGGASKRSCSDAYERL